MAYHLKLSGFSGGFVGVDVFFVISGYLITGHLIGDLVEGRGVRLADFYAGRVRRILPAATATIVLTMVAGLILQNPLDFSETAGEDARSSALFVSNIWFWLQSTDYLAEAGSPSLFQQFWSLSAEEQFYFVWPILFGLIAWVVACSAGSAAAIKRSLVVCLAALVAASFALSVNASMSDPSAAFFLLQNRGWEMGLGALLALVSVRVGSLLGAGSAWLAALGLGAIVFSIFVYSSSTRWPGAAAALPVVGTVLVIGAGIHDDRSPVGSLLALRPMKAVGRYSYSIYLWHWPLVVLIAEPLNYSTTAVVGVASLTAVLAIASFWLVENPARSSGLLARRTNLTLLAGLGLVGLAVVASFIPVVLGPRLDTGQLSGSALHEPGSPIVVTEFVPADLDPKLSDGTSVDDPNAERNIDCELLERCASGPTDAPVRIVVFGDSHAGHWAPSIERIATDRGWRYDRLTKGGCSVYKFNDEGCANWLGARWLDIGEIQPDILVIASRYDGDVDMAARMSEALVNAPPETKVVLLSDTPESTEVVPRCLAENLEDVVRCEPQWPNPAVEEVNSVLADVAEASGAYFADLTEIMCTTDRCPAIAGNILVYRDRNHITTALRRIARVRRGRPAAPGSVSRSCGGIEVG